MKATKRPMVSVLRWAVVNTDGKYVSLDSGDVLLWTTRKKARGFSGRCAGVVRVRVTVEVVE